ncbi:MAG: helix-turn-helix transcriptional regulator [Gordonibacter sp.]|uniref:helix-turn-helix transcriptional regulator n=1 Tax=Gordonibacter sp. TaxID=1968902 RepID=UPI002FC6CCF0
MELNEKLKALRQERGMTQEQVAAKLYVSRTAVSKWETGGGSPNLDSLQALARLFEVSVDELR